MAFRCRKTKSLKCLKVGVRASRDFNVTAGSWNVVVAEPYKPSAQAWDAKAKDKLLTLEVADVRANRIK